MTMPEAHLDRTTGTISFERPGQSLPGRRRQAVPDDRRDSCNAGRSKSIVVLGAGDLLARRVTRALITSGHDVTVAVFADDAHESFGESCPVIRAENPDALRRAVASHDAVINLEPVIGKPRSELGALWITGRYDAGPDGWPC
jgi:hypothetical protein